MKLVAAKCPSCGANIEVDKKMDSTKCEYCKTKIIVDDAIEKYKLEVEIKNIPKLENYLKLGMRYYKENDYEEANNYFNKALELDPDNIEAIFYRGITKSYCTTYKEFDILSSLKVTKEVLARVDTKDKAKYILELEQTNTNLKDFAISFYNEHNLNYNSMEEYIEKLKLCLIVYEYCYKNISTIEHKKTILNKIILLIKYILKRKVYRDNYFQKTSYYVSLDTRVELMKKLSEYKKEIYILDPNKKIKDEKRNKQVLKISSYIFVEMFLFTMFIGAIKLANPIWSIALFIDFILVLPFISKILFKNKKVELIIKIILLLIGMIGLICFENPEFLNYKYKSKTNDMVIEFKNKKAIINNKKYNYSYESKTLYTLIKINDYEFKYRNSNDKYLFCLLENDECIHYFYSNNKNHKYIEN